MTIWCVEFDDKCHKSDFLFENKPYYDNERAHASTIFFAINLDHELKQIVWVR